MTTCFGPAWPSSGHKLRYKQRGENVYLYMNKAYLDAVCGGSVVVKALRYKSESPRIDSRCRRVFFPWHLTVPCALGSTQPLKMSTRLILGVKAAGA
jgi:hypothetical protein